MAYALVARGCVYGMQEFLDVASKEFMDDTHHHLQSR
jgi:hypothetical protein